MNTPDPAPEPRPAATAVGPRVMRAVLTTSASQLILIVLGFATSVAQARLLGAAGRGDVMRFANAGALAVLYLGFGINSAITYFVASGALQPRALLRMLRPALLWTVLAVAAGFFALSVSGLQRFLPQSLPAPWPVVTLSAFFALTQLGSWLSALLAARGDFGPTNTSTVVVGGAGAAASLALLWLRPAWADAGAIIVLGVALEALRAGMLGYACWQHERESRPDRRPRGAAGLPQPLHFSQLLRYSLLTYLGEALQFLTYRFDMWVVDAYHGAAALGRYSLAVSLAQLVWIVPSAAARVLFPYTAMLERADAAQLAWRSARLGLLVSVLAALLGMLATRLFLVALFGSQFADVPGLMAVLLLGIVPYSISKVLGNYLAGINALATNVFASGAGLLLTVALDLWLIPRAGELGAAWATAISYSAYTLLLIGLFMRKSSLSVAALFARPRSEHP